MLAIRPRYLQALAQDGVGVIDHVAEHVQVLPGGVHRGDLDRRGQPQPEFGRGPSRLLHAVHAVVVAQGEQLDAGLRGGRHHSSRLKRAVGVQRVALQIEAGRIGAQAPRG